MHTAAAAEGGSGSSVDAPLQGRPRGDKGKGISGQRREEKNRKGWQAVGRGITIAGGARR